MVSIQLSRIGTKEALALMAGARAETPRHSVNGETASDRIADRHSDDSLHVSHVHVDIDKRKRLTAEDRQWLSSLEREM